MAEKRSRKRKAEDALETNIDDKKRSKASSMASGEKDQHPKPWGRNWNSKTHPQLMEPIKEWLVKNVDAERLKAMRNLEIPDGEYGGFGDKIGNIHWQDYVLSAPKEDRIPLLLLIFMIELPVGGAIQFDHSEVYFRAIAEDDVDEMCVPTMDFCMNPSAMFSWIPTNKDTFSKPLIAVGKCTWPPMSFNMKQIYVGFDVSEETMLISVLENKVGVTIIEWNLDEIVEFIKTGDFGKYKEFLIKIELHDEMLIKWFQITLMQFLWQAKPNGLSEIVERIEIVDQDFAGYKMNSIQLFWDEELSDLTP